MSNLVAVVFGAVFIALFCEHCNGLDSSDDVASRVQFVNTANEKDAGGKLVGSIKRVTRQAYQGQTQLYPSVPSGPPYGSYQPNQHPQQWQQNSNHSQGYPQNGNSWPHNSQPGSYSQYNYTTSTQYPGFKPGNNYNPSARPPYAGQSNNSYSGYPPYGQNSSWQPHRPNNGQPYQPPGPYQPGGSYTKNNSTYPGFHPGNSNNINSIPYGQPGQANSGHPSYGQNSTLRPGHQNPVVYDDSTRRPGQNLYGNSNANNNWNALNNTRPGYGQNGQYPSGYPNSPGYGSVNSTNPYNPSQRPPYGQNNGYPGSNQYPGNGYPGSNQYPANVYPGPNQNPGSSYPGSNQYPGGYPGSSNPGGQNPSPYNPYPGVSPYGPPGGPPAGHHDPTKVSPQHFNSN